MYRCADCGATCDDGLCSSCKHRRNEQNRDAEQHEDEWENEDD